MAKKICLDAGHYGKYNRSPAVPAYYESDFNWKFHLLLKAALEKYGFEVKLTRSNQAKDMVLVERGKAAKGCDLFLSIHSNAVDGKVHEDIDYPVACVPIDGKGDKLGKQLAECVASVMGTKQKADCWSKKSTSGTANWYGVIHGAALVGVTGIILEHSFHTNTRSTKWLMDENNLQKMAQREAEVIADYFGVKPKNDTKPAQTTKPVEAAKPEQAAKDKGVWYLVSLGAYSDPNNAKNMLAKAKAAGFKDAYITTKPKD